MNLSNTLQAWMKWRKSLVQAAHNPESDWMDEEDVHSVLAEANRAGVSARTVVCCKQLSHDLSGSPAAPGSQNNRKATILLVEPVDALREKLSHLLEGTGVLQVRTACDAKEALVVAREAAPDLLITEMELAGRINGAGLAHYLRSSLQRPIPIIILEDVLQGTDVSVVTFTNALHLQKPLKFRALLHCINHLLTAAGGGQKAAV
jgi:CheY-like chemotaxis protein